MVETLKAVIEEDEKNGLDTTGLENARREIEWAARYRENSTIRRYTSKLTNRKRRDIRGYPIENRKYEDT